MAAERTQNLQDTFLNYVRKNKVPLTIFLINGVKEANPLAIALGVYCRRIPKYR